MIPWRVRRQMVAVVFVTIVMAIAVGWTIYFFAFAPSCTDRKMNGNEENVDCGGSCGPCLDTTLRDPVVIWTRFFSLGENLYDVAAYVKNENIKSGGKLSYTLALVDEAGNTIAEKKGEVILRPSASTVLYAPSLTTTKVPTRANVALSLNGWQYEQPEQIGVVSVGHTTSATPTPTLTVKLRNQTYVESVPIEVTALLLDALGNVYALSRTERGPIQGGAIDEAVFTWPKDAVIPPPARVEVLVTASRGK